MTRAIILMLVNQERLRQDAEWGGPDHDRKHNSHDWIAYIVKHTGKAVMTPFRPETFVTSMLKVAALAVAAVEWASDTWGDDVLPAKPEGLHPSELPPFKT